MLDTPAAPVKAGDMAFDADDSPLAVFRLIAQNCLSHLQLNHDDPEYVRQVSDQ